ncbi:flagellar biosynthetic protein FliR [Maridesulfovibrio hydrothermalis]|uniref:Flagellar biosynthetic protein FliR n=1 Tax=Maridesulfovibrio hydrothermalis AM13 = DSM 14728 TaxID=1121451 RepID=L0RDV2_9BACT|nr:flagellar biosynthetic protein FliR [Maridesulfovibrio hydrothermalis]CCO24953.1 Flagellar biosynthetic protein fliR [Maridesulfovibrio hydrothermalis AM13 = DSM 14728]
MNLFNFSPSDLMSFYLTFFRVSIVLFLLPFFGGRSIPNLVKAALTIVLTLGIWPHVSFDGSLMPSSPYNIALMILGEVVLGLVLGVAVHVMFSAIQTGGNFIGVQMGFSMVNVLDPVTGVNEAVTAHFLYMTAILVFLCLNGHLYLMSAMIESFKYIPPGQIFISSKLTTQIMTISRDLFILAVKVASPIIASIFVVDLALALISKMAPQMNVLMLGFPLKIMVGFFFLSMVFSVLGLYVSEYVTTMPALLLNIIKAGSPPPPLIGN